MLTGLGGGDDEAPGFNGAGAQQHMPVCLPGGPGEGRRHRQDRRAGRRQRPVQRRKAQIITDGQAQAAPRRRGHHGFFTSLISRGFPPAFAAQHHVKQVDLGIAGGDGAGGIDQETAVDEFFADALQGQAAQLHPHAGAGGSGANGGEHHVIGFAADLAGRAGPVAIEQAAHFRGKDDLRALGGGLGNLGRKLFSLDGRNKAGAGLDQGNGQRHATSSVSSLPARSSARRSSQPPT